MAKVIGALLSLDAKGNLKKCLNFSHGGGHNIVRKAKASIAPRDPRTDIQKFNRAYFSDTIAIWHVSDSENKQIYIQFAKPMSMTAFNLYIKTYRAKLPSDVGLFSFGFSNVGIVV
jgi:hypothetical protein